MRFRGLTQKNSDDELSDIDPHNLDDPGRRNTFGGLDHTWTTDLKLNVMASELKGKGRLTLEDSDGGLTQRKGIVYDDVRRSLEEVSKCLKSHSYLDGLFVSHLLYTVLHYHF